MRLLSVLLVSFSFSSIGLLNPPSSLSSNLIAQLNTINNVTTDVLASSGYDCQTEGSVGVACTKCTTEDSITEKCTAYICDTVTKKCRQEKAVLPEVSGTNNEITPDLNLNTNPEF